MVSLSKSGPIYTASRESIAGNKSPHPEEEEAERFQDPQSRLVTAHSDVTAKDEAIVINTGPATGFNLHHIRNQNIRHSTKLFLIDSLEAFSKYITSVEKSGDSKPVEASDKSELVEYTKKSSWKTISPQIRRLIITITIITVILAAILVPVGIWLIRPKIHKLGINSVVTSTPAALESTNSSTEAIENSFTNTTISSSDSSIYTDSPPTTTVTISPSTPTTLTAITSITPSQSATQSIPQTTTSKITSTSPVAITKPPSSTSNCPSPLVTMTEGGGSLRTCSWGCAGWKCKDYNDCEDPLPCTFTFNANRCWKNGYNGPTPTC